MAHARNTALPALLAPALALLAALPYLAAGLSPTFLPLDDPAYITFNGAVRQGLSLPGLRWALGAFYADNWHPLTWLSHMTDVSLFGLEPRGHHAVGLALHALGATALFTALHRMTGAPLRSAFVAALFGIHPLHVESVAWAAERKDVLSGLLFALVLVAYERYARRPGAGRYLTVASLLTLGLMSKATLVATPVVLLLIDFWPLGRLRGDVPPRALLRSLPILEKLPFLALSVACAVPTVLAHQGGGTLPSLVALPPSLRVSNAAVAAATYISQSVWPSGLAIFYPFPLDGHPWWKSAAAALLLAAISAAALSLRRSRPYFVCGWFWYLALLVPVSGLVQTGLQAHADRYTYLSLTGLFLLPAWGLPGLIGGRRRRAAALGAAAGVSLALLAALTAAQAARWHNPETLFTHSLAVTSDNWLVHSALGNMLFDRGLIERSLSHCQEAVRILPGYAEAQLGLGNALDRLGRRDEALAAYREAVRISPRHVTARYNLGLLLSESGRFREAVPHYREALRIQRGSGPHPGLPLDPVKEAIVAYKLEQALRLGGGAEASR
jgi:tetratricopeptide (TPR) repeat protein